ncbi:4-hydroxy-tetrahydrodipicolinate synthase [Mucilaginibacter arboris]|uniref:4-hydroxy-tetrahydrodipicolinate synthase n=1 Tax=Mucilaginibacter arboris TaxID=2682090 RepID=A0A7K1STU9_9SPHI|nr:4-hydroxy-tetrahydrodipicolinate synthase [Mucilaginibacter arboris]MVN20746.1 4-hydroxy-tetrahydrodipicolinate synthase [Mucilaginibacter arboris]
MKKFYGTGVAIVTPFQTDGSVDFSGLENIIENLIGNGIDYLISLGTTGESATLTSLEKKEIWKFTAQTVAGRVPLVAGVGGNYTAAVVENIKNLDKQGFDAILSVSPYYNKPTQEGIYQHYKTIAAQSELPVILYNVPGRTGSNISAETTVRLAHDCTNIIAIKEASGNFDQFNQIMRDKPESFMLISGDDPVTLPMIALGAVGVISVIGNAVPQLFSDMVRLCLDGKWEAARIIHYQLIEFTKLMFIDGNPAGVKEALKLTGLCENTLRLPLVNVSPKVSGLIAAELKNLNS